MTWHIYTYLNDDDDDDEFIHIERVSEQVQKEIKNARNEIKQ